MVVLDRWIGTQTHQRCACSNLNQITKSCECWKHNLSGNYDINTGKYAAAANLYGTWKPDQSVRPIAAGDVSDRIWGKSIMRSKRDEYRNILEPEQLCISKNGTEK